MFLHLSLFGQSFTNDWIDYSKKYYKFKIGENGIYRITFNDLNSANFPLSTNPQTFQLFFKGQEQYIYIEGEDDGSFDSPDYIEFYGEANDGWMDTSLFDSANWHTNPNYSFFSDTSTYFLTWDINATPKRVTIENDINFANYTPSSYFLKTVREDYTSQYARGFYQENSASFDPEYTEAESWVGNQFNTPISKTITTSNISTNGPNAQIEIGLVGRNIQQHAVEVSFASINETISYDKTKTNFLSYSISANNLTNSNTFSFTPTLNNDYNSIAFIDIVYPSTYNLDNAANFKMLIPDGPGLKSYLEITNFDNQSSVPILYDLSNHKRIQTDLNSGLIKALVPNSGSNKTCYLSSVAATKSIGQLIPVGNGGFFTEYTPIGNDSAYIIISNEKLYNDNFGNNWIEQYAIYRSSIAGGNYDVINANIEELIDQFAYGVDKHPLSIKEFANHALYNWPSPPKYLLLIGKGISADLCRKSPVNQSNNLIPTYGNSPSDILLTAGLYGTQLQPAISTGRISAKTGEEVQMYLDKIKEYDNNNFFYEQTLGQKNWMKRILHFGGGGSISEQTTFQNYLSIYESFLEDTIFGGYVHRFFKSSSDPIQITISDSITSLINNGVSLMTFFGHASGNGFDQNIDYPDNYTNNNGKYPLLIGNSCLAGDIFKSSSNSYSEQWILHERGVIGFLASVDYGVPNLLNTYCREVIKNISYNQYGNSIGHCIRKGIEKVQIYPTLKKTCLSMTYHGDPAVIINSHSKPDYTITEKDIYFTPNNISTEIDSFEINVIVSNIGRAINKNLEITITRNYPIESNISPYSHYTYINPGPYYKDTVKLKLPVDIENGLGLNLFSILIDPSNNIDELSETNNDIINIQLLLKTADITPVSPYPYAVVPHKDIILKASTGNPFETPKTYRFEIDTTDLFFSPLASRSFAQSGGVVKWDPQEDPSLNAIYNSYADDSTVFFWRTRIDSTSIADSNHTWKESSFQYIDQISGWGQEHFFQFKNNDFNLIDYDRNNRSFNFISTPKELKCNVIGTDINSPNGWGTGQGLENNFTIDNTITMAGSHDPVGAIIIAVIDPITLIPWQSSDYNFGEICNSTYSCNDHNAFIFHSSPSNTTYSDYIDTMLQSIPDSNYILLYTYRNGNFKNWSSNLLTTMQSLGSSQLVIGSDTLENNTPYAFFTKKGEISTAQEVVGFDSSDKIQLSAELKTNYDFGYITSKAIGHAKTWHRAYWNFNYLEPNDSVRLEIIGLNNNGQETVLPNFTNILPNTDSIDISNIDASTYSRIKLRVYLKDDSLKTPAQIDSWHVVYEKYPEAALNGSLLYSFISDTLDEGETVEISTILENISDMDMDSMHVSYWIVDQARNTIPIKTEIKKPLLQEPDTIQLKASYSTIGLGGQNSFWIEANPIDSATGIPYQDEQYHFNNIAEIPFYVQGDYKNPLLDVTFDGVHILNGDIVSAKPEISIQLTDENNYLALDTNSLMNIYLTKPDENIAEIIPFDENTLKFIPADLPDNKAKVLYNPTFNEDGIYELRIQATDKSKNESGDIDYTISFEIINKASITEIFNWPNPFSTNTRFVFTLTGSMVPEDFRIRIMTVTGKIVKEILSNELGPIHIGKNITTYSWNGTDEFGDQLANGIYLYKVDVRLNGETLERRETNADKYFHKGFGKMYLIR